MYNTFSANISSKTRAWPPESAPQWEIKLFTDRPWRNSGDPEPQGPWCGLDCGFCGISEQGRVRKPQEDVTEKEKPGEERQCSRKGELHAQRLGGQNGTVSMEDVRSQPGSEDRLTAAQGNGDSRLSGQNVEN